MDRVGRKPLMLTGVIGCCACLIVEAAMIATFASPVPTVDPNRAGLRTGVAAFYVFLLFYGCGIDVAGVVFYSEVSIYSDVTQSFGGQGPDIYADTSLGATTRWENNKVTWSYAGGDPNQADTFTEFINANAQDPAIPTFSQVGCAQYTQGFPGGALGHTWNCYKDNPRQLYATSDHECSTVYYCRIAPFGTCNLPGSGKSPQCRTYWMFADKLSCCCEVGGAVEGSLRRWRVK